ncbi:hypothetical protein [Sphingosinicella rhizophila]|uniref:VCBS repeat protein n=1 Tax=Sphingosinicella rhizophila TaxID=3050082 RepID=A0ABU3QAZ7_9SPHN|nr:hypothetical protein [Sphingosinicella sp. GR2756]MDT9600178.1 hypothetical protein [Sphingosinicella sp. GR2756]
MRRIIVVLALAWAAPALPQAGVPEPIRNRVNELVARCVEAGGAIGSMSGQGRFVIPADFNGDGRVDFVVSEGNVPCTGRPDLFRTNGLALVQLYLGEPEGAKLVFQDRLVAYRILAGRPARMQIARRGSACGAEGQVSARCGDELRWNAAARRFEEHATDGRSAAGKPLIRPATIVGTSTASTTATVPIPGANAKISGPDLPWRSGAEVTFKSQCRQETRSRYPTMTSASIASSCDDSWNKVVAAGPIADALLAVVPARTGERIFVSDLRSRLPQVRWRPAANIRENRPTAEGMMNGLSVSVSGAPAVESIAFGWRKLEAEPPYDIPAALAAKGAKVTALGCFHFGPSEVSRTHIVSAPGRASFALETYIRAAAMGGQESWISASANLTEKLPTLASLRAEHPDPAWEAVCPH